MKDVDLGIGGASMRRRRRGNSISTPPEGGAPTVVSGQITDVMRSPIPGEFHDIEVAFSEPVYNDTIAPADGWDMHGIQIYVNEELPIQEFLEGSGTNKITIRLLEIQVFAANILHIDSVDAPERWKSVSSDLPVALGFAFPVSNETQPEG